MFTYKHQIERLTGNLISIEALEERRILHGAAEAKLKNASHTAEAILRDARKAADKIMNEKCYSAQKADLLKKMDGLRMDMAELKSLAITTPVDDLKPVYHKKAGDRQKAIDEIDRSILNLSRTDYENKKKRVEEILESAKAKATEVQAKAEESETVAIDRQVREIIRRKALRLVEVGDIAAARRIAVGEGDEPLLGEIRNACAAKADAMDAARELVSEPEKLGLPKDAKFVAQMNSLIIAVDGGMREVGRMVVSPVGTSYPIEARNQVWNGSGNLRWMPVAQ